MAGLGGIRTQVPSLGVQYFTTELSISGRKCLVKLNIYHNNLVFMIEKIFNEHGGSRRDSNSGPPAWESSTLPLSYPILAEIVWKNSIYTTRIWFS